MNSDDVVILLSRTSDFVMVLIYKNGETYKYGVYAGGAVIDIFEKMLRIKNVNFKAFNYLKQRADKIIEEKTYGFKC